MTYGDVRQRTRTRDRSTTESHVYSNYLGTVTTGYRYNISGSYEKMVDVVDPGFFAKRKLRIPVFNPMSKVTSTRSFTHLVPPVVKTEPTLTPDHWARYDGQYGWLVTGPPATTKLESMVFDSLIPADDVQKLQTEVSTRCLSQVGRSDTNNWENLAEMGKTAALLQSPLASWFKFEKKARILTAGLSAANAWLAYRYGIRPLVKSVDVTLKNLAKHAKRTVDWHTTRASGMITRSLNDTITTNSTWYGSAYFNVARQRTESVRVRATSLDELDMDLQYTLGLQSKDLLTLPWELIPYSFVVDWFANVGDFIGAVTQSCYPKSLGQSLTTEYIGSEYRITNSMTAFSPSVVAVVQEGKGSCRFDQIRKDRSTALASPGLVFKADFRLDNLTRLGDSFALVGQQIAKTFSNRR